MAGAAVLFLAGFCREHPLDEKIFIVPSFVAGRRIGEALAAEAGSFINLRFLTLPTLAAEILEGSGRAGAARPMTSSAELALTDRLYRELLDSGKLEYFRPAGASPGLSLALHRALRDLRLDGLTSAALEARHFLVESKGRELALLLGLYERELEEKKLLDLPALLARAAEAASKAPVSARVLCPADRPLSRLERGLLEAAASGHPILVPGDPIFGLERPRQCCPVPASAAPAPSGRMSWLFAPREAKAGIKGPEIEIFRALGPANECREILRRLAADKIPFDQAEVLAPAGSAHATAFFLYSSRTGLPVTFGDGLPVSFTSPGRLFLGLAAWLAGDFLSDELCRLLENGDIVLPGPVAGAPLPARSACRHLRRAMIGWGRDRYADRLAALLEGTRADLDALAKDEGDEDCDRAGGRAEAFIEAIAEIDALAAGVGRVLEPIPRPGADGKYDLRSLCSTGGPRWLCSTGWRRSSPRAGPSPCLSGRRSTFSARPALPSRLAPLRPFPAIFMFPRCSREGFPAGLSRSSPGSTRRAFRAAASRTRSSSTRKGRRSRRRSRHRATSCARISSGSPPCLPRSGDASS
jgi:hypothetical protein